jgi:hypothetical protein
MNSSSLVSSVRSGRHRTRLPTRIHRTVTVRSEDEAIDAVVALQPVEKVLSAKIVFDDDDGTPSVQYLARWKVRRCNTSAPSR